MYLLDKALLLGLTMILSDFDLRNYIATGRLLIQPFDPSIIRENGVDLRLGDEYCVLKYDNEEIVDPYNMHTDELAELYECYKADEVVIKPHRHYLLHTLEYVKLPPELMGIVELRSTFARLGLIIPPTVIDGGFEGQLTIELLGGSFPVKLKAGQRFLHVIFAKVTTPIERPYKGKYQGQRGVTLPKLPIEL